MKGNLALSAPLKIVISGASGFIGQALSRYLRSSGHHVLSLVRRPPANENEIFWDPYRGMLDSEELEGADAFVHLSGENIASGRWTAAKRQLISESRITTTRLLVDVLNRLRSPPKVLLSASAVSYYGNAITTPCSESGLPGSDFLALVCRAWEAEAEKCTVCRVVPLRFAGVLSPSGGPLRSILPPFRVGLGGVLGSGEQIFGWITLDDTLKAIHLLICDQKFNGPINITTPFPISNKTLTETLGLILHRPTALPMPGFILRILAGEITDSILLASHNVMPQRLLDGGFTFDYPHITEALKHILNKGKQ